MNKYEKRTAEKKKAIVEAATELFSKQGFKGTSVSEIAAKAQVSQVSIYNYFGSKEALVKECAFYILRENINDFKRIVAEKNGFVENLERAVALCVESSHELLDRYFGKQAADDEIFSELLRQSDAELRSGVMAAFLESGKAEGVIDPSFQTDVLLDFINMALSLQGSWKRDDEYDSKVESLYRLMLYGLLGHK